MKLLAELVILLAGAAAILGFSLAGGDKTDDIVRIGVLNDQSGVYAYLGGVGSVLAAQMAAEDFAPEIPGVRVEVLSADHRNKPDVGANIARRWFDVEHVDVIADVPTSSVALAVAQIARDKNKVFLGSGAGTSDLTGKACSPNTVHWTYDTYAVATAVARAVVAAGGRRWFFVTVDYAAGYALERDASGAIAKSGGTVIGSVRHPLGASDFSSFLLQAKASGAEVIGLADAGADAVNAIKSAHEFGITKAQKIAALLVVLPDIHSLGVDVAQGLVLAEPFYWARDDATRAWSMRFFEKRREMPNSEQAGVYAATIHYLKAVKALGSHSDGRAVVAQMKKMPAVDPLFGDGRIREDGRKIHPMYLYRVKKPSESTGEWDLYTLVKKVPGEEAFRPIRDGGCALIGGR